MSGARFFFFFPPTRHVAGEKHHDCPFVHLFLVYLKIVIARRAETVSTFVPSPRWRHVERIHPMAARLRFGPTRVSEELEGWENHLELTIVPAKDAGLVFLCSRPKDPTNS